MDWYRSLEVARFLAMHPKVSAVHYPGLETQGRSASRPAGEFVDADLARRTQHRERGNRAFQAAGHSKEGVKLSESWFEGHLPT